MKNWDYNENHKNEEEKDFFPAFRKEWHICRKVSRIASNLEFMPAIVYLTFM